MPRRPLHSCPGRAGLATLSRRMSETKRISRERAERIAKSYACTRCGEYSYKRVKVTPATKRLEESLGVVWSTEQVCGVCDSHLELGIDEDGTIVYVS